MGSLSIDRPQVSPDEVTAEDAMKVVLPILLSLMKQVIESSGLGGALMVHLLRANWIWRQIADAPETRLYLGREMVIRAGRQVVEEFLRRLGENQEKWFGPS